MKFDAYDLDQIFGEKNMRKDEWNWVKHNVKKS
jgi:hypothetical protein